MNSTADCPIGLVKNPPGVGFKCGTCKFLDKLTRKKCNNPDSKLFGKKVEEVWCCNKYFHPGMETVIK